MTSFLCNRAMLVMQNECQLLLQKLISECKYLWMVATASKVNKGKYRININIDECMLKMITALVPFST